MTQNDYLAVAEIIGMVKEYFDGFADVPQNEDFDAHTQERYSNFIEYVCMILERDNPHFNQFKFKQMVLKHLPPNIII